MYTLKDYYKAARPGGKMRAFKALAKAREGKERGTSHRLWRVRFVGYNPRKNGIGWVENANSGLRFVAYADNISERIQHTGWWADDDGFQSFRGVVYQLPTRKRVMRYVVGYADPDNDFCALIDFSTMYTDKWEAAFAADRFAEKRAEDEREYNEGYTAGDKYRELGESIKEVRVSALKLIREIKAAKRAFTPEICMALHFVLKTKLTEIRNNRQERDALKDAQYKISYAAFNDGAGKTIFKVG